MALDGALEPGDAVERGLPRALTFWTAALDYRPRDVPDGDWATADWTTTDWAVLVPRSQLVFRAFPDLPPKPDWFLVE